MNNIKEIVNKIDEFAKIREDEETIYSPYIYSNRLNWIINFLRELNIPFHLTEDENDDDEIIRNVYLPGTNNKLIVAHHDVAETEYENANDNSCSVINAIALKVFNPDANVVLTDGEEIGFLGAQKLSHVLYEHDNLPKIDYIVVLELTGLGKNLVISKYNKQGKLHNFIKKNFNAYYKEEFPINEAKELSKRNLEAELVTTAPKINEQINFKHFENVHTKHDTLETINKNDMEFFINNFLLSISSSNF